MNHLSLRTAFQNYSYNLNFILLQGLFQILFDSKNLDFFLFLTAFTFLVHAMALICQMDLFFVLITTLGCIGFL